MIRFDLDRFCGQIDEDTDLNKQVFYGRLRIVIKYNRKKIKIQVQN